MGAEPPLGQAHGAAESREFPTQADESLGVSGSDEEVAFIFRQTSGCAFAGWVVCSLVGEDALEEMDFAIVVDSQTKRRAIIIGDVEKGLVARWMGIILETDASGDLGVGG